MSPGRVPLGEQVTHGREPPAVPGGDDIVASGDAGRVLHSCRGWEHHHLCRGAVVAQGYLAVLKGPHLDGAALGRVGGSPETHSLVRVGANGVREVEHSLVAAVARVDASNPSCLVA